MTNNQNDSDPSKIQSLILFKQDVKETLKKEAVALESVEQEDKIKLVYEIKPYGGNYRYSIMLINQSSKSITNIKIKIIFPAFLELHRCSPPTIVEDEFEADKDKAQQVKLDFDELPKNTKKQINLYLIPKTLNHKGEIRTYVNFVNYQDYVRVLNSDPVDIVVPPLTIEKTIIPSSKIGEIYDDKNFKKALKSYGVGIEGEDDEDKKDLYFNIMEQILRFHNMQLIAKDIDKKVLWYFGKCWNKNEIETSNQFEVLVIGQLEANKIEFLITSKNPEFLVSLATIISNDLKRRILSTGIVKSAADIYDLECKNCGLALKSFPMKGESIECENCHYDQIVW